MKKTLLITIIFTILASIGFGQDCNDFFNFSKYSNCNKCVKANYKIYLQPKHTNIKLKDTLTYNVVFYGGRDYVISFCADQQYYPLHIQLLSPKTRIVLYDNAVDYYLESIPVGVYNTQNIILKVSLLAEELDEKKKLNTHEVCVGMVLQWKKILSKSNKLYLKTKKPIRSK